ncbi:hypothetical protein NL676_013574 [Syzygium grande]|nr:hypothetical protein NL676_013574 [Syzygium grande]
MATGRPAWGLRAESNAYALMIRIGVGDETPEMPEGLSEQGKDFLRKCFAKNPKKRWTARMLLKHPFLALDGVTDDEDVVRDCGVEFEDPSPKCHFDFQDWASVQCSRRSWESGSLSPSSETDSDPSFTGELAALEITVDISSVINRIVKKRRAPDAKRAVKWEDDGTCSHRRDGWTVTGCPRMVVGHPPDRVIPFSCALCGVRAIQVGAFSCSDDDEEEDDDAAGAVFFSGRWFLLLAFRCCARLERDTAEPPFALMATSPSCGDLSGMAPPVDSLPAPPHVSNFGISLTQKARPPHFYSSARGHRGTKSHQKVCCIESCIVVCVVTNPSLKGEEERAVSQDFDGHHRRVVGGIGFGWHGEVDGELVMKPPWPISLPPTQSMVSRILRVFTGFLEKF